MKSVVSHFFVRKSTLLCLKEDKGSCWPTAGTQSKEVLYFKSFTKTTILSYPRLLLIKNEVILLYDNK